MVRVKSKSDIEKMRVAGKLTAKVLELMRSMAQEGVSTKAMDDEAEALIRGFGATPSFKGYNGFKYATCMSIDDVVVHGFPSLRPLKRGEILSVDVGVFYDGFHADAARTFAIGEVEPQKLRLMEVTKQCFFEGIKFARAGCRLGDISATIQHLAEKNGFGVVRTMSGHGIGRRLHEEPSIPNYGKAGTGLMLKSGYALAIEPMITAGGYEVYIDTIDRWTCKTKDGSVAAHYENTIVVGEQGCDILTMENGQ